MTRMSWRRAVGFALIVLAALVVMRSSCDAPGYDWRKVVRRPHRQHGPNGRGPGARGPRPQPGTLPAASGSLPLPLELDDDAIDDARDTATWTPPAPVSLAAEEPTPCPKDMVLVEGEYCPQPQQVCLRWLDEGSEFLPQHRCATFQRPSKCLSAERTYMRFCIDRDEHGDPATGLPASNHSWTMAVQLCQSEDKRLCAESEWVFACEGEDMLPYPTGYERDASACNFDHADLMDNKGKLKDLRKRADDLARCVSPFGARNLVGNVDEWVVREGVAYPPFRSALKGGWWMAARNRCRPATTAHDEHYTDTQTGFRCCRDAP